MQFLFPAFLWALLFLSIPILIHLFYFRRYKQVLFTNVRFLKELVEETSSKNKLKNLLILLFRFLALAAIIFAFCQPFLSNEKNKSLGTMAISIFIDNSWSMEADAEEGSLFQKAKRRALDIVNAYSENDRFQILTHSLEGKHLRMVSKPDAISFIEEIQVGSEVNPLSKIFEKQKQTLANANLGISSAYIISDFQSSIFDLNVSQVDSTVQLFFIPLQSIRENNLSLDTAYFISPIIIPGIQNPLVYRVTNFGNSDAEAIRVSFNLNQQEFPGGVVNVRAGKTIEDTLYANIQNPGWQKAIVKIKDYPITFDDPYYLSFKAEEEIRILSVYSKVPNLQIQQALESIPYFKSTSKELNALDYSSFKNYHLIVLTEIEQASSGLAKELKKALDEGTNVLIFPQPNMPETAYESLYRELGISKLERFVSSEKQVGNVNLEEDLFKDVFANPRANIRLPITKGNYQLVGGSPRESILVYRDGSTMLAKFKLSKGYIYLCAAPLQAEYSDLSKNAEIFLPLLFKSAISGNKSQRFSHTIGQTTVIPWIFESSFNQKDLSVKMSGPEEFIPGLRIGQNQLLLEVYDQPKKAGIYDLKHQEKILGAIAFNDSRLESNPNVEDIKELESRFMGKVEMLDASENLDFNRIVKSKTESKPYWWNLLVFALICLVGESMIIRYWKNT
ncbi:MAG: BatA domain-containing protein [Bacteroidota bacterium]|nr:BatA domain-containing protein [Bacteroidota bacterium]